jgi:hypothetical protein
MKKQEDAAKEETIPIRGLTERLVEKYVGVFA